MAESPRRRFVLPAGAGKAARFWEIVLVERRCELRYGVLVGSEGSEREREVETRRESFKNPAVAQVKAMTKIRRKREAGYVEVAPSLPPQASTRRALEHTLCEEPDSHEAWAVYADFVQGELPGLGERIMLELELEACETSPAGGGEGDGERRAALGERISALDERAERWISPRLVELSQGRGFAELAQATWRMGMIDALRLRSLRVFRPQCSVDVVLGAALASPVTRFMTRLSIELGPGGRPKEIEQAAARLVESGSRPALRALVLEGATSSKPAALPALERCLALSPRLEQLTLRGRLNMGRSAEHERLRHLSLSCESEKSAWIGRLGGLRMPALERLELRRESGGRYRTRAHELLPLCRDAELPALTELHLSVQSEGNTALLELSETPLFQRLRILWIAQVDNGAAQTILDVPERFAHLERLVLRGGRIYGPIREELRALKMVSFL